MLFEQTKASWLPGAVTAGHVGRGGWEGAGVDTLAPLPRDVEGTPLIALSLGLPIWRSTQFSSDGAWSPLRIRSREWGGTRPWTGGGVSRLLQDTPHRHLLAVSGRCCHEHPAWHCGGMRRGTRRRPPKPGQPVRTTRLRRPLPRGHPPRLPSWCLAMTLSRKTHRGQSSLRPEIWGRILRRAV